MVSVILGNLTEGFAYEDIRRLQVIKFTQEASTVYEDLVRQKIRIGTRDLRIAATVISVNAIVVTRNRKDFAKVPGLRIEDWTVD
jgi:tRNA(fMet)-specific endonuclease VapC